MGKCGKSKKNQKKANFPKIGTLFACSQKIKLAKISRLCYIVVRNQPVNCQKRINGAGFFFVCDGYRMCGAHGRNTEETRGIFTIFAPGFDFWQRAERRVPIRETSHAQCCRGRMTVSTT
jgi:hypothetical protein